jgi:hypothetical protein
LLTSTVRRSALLAIARVALGRRFAAQEVSQEAPLLAFGHERVDHHIAGPLGLGVAHQQVAPREEGVHACHHWWWVEVGSIFLSKKKPGFGLLVKSVEVLQQSDLGADL